MTSMKTFLAVVILMLFPLWRSSAQAEDGRSTTVLLLAPVELKSRWLDGVLIQTAAALRDGEKMLYPRIRYITPGIPGSFRRRRAIEELKSEFSSNECGAVITFDGISADFLVSEREAIGMSVPLIAARLKQSELQRLRNQYANVTGTVRYDMLENITVQAARLFPQSQDIIVAAAAETPPEQCNEIRYRMNTQLPGRRITCLFGAESSPDNILAKIAKSDTTPIVILSGWPMPAPEKKIMTEHAFISRLAETHKIPVFSLSDDGFGSGLAGERVLKADNCGAMIANMTERVLKEESAVGIPFKNESPALTVDYEALTALGADLNAIPPEAEIVNPPPEPVWPLIFYISGSGAVIILLMLLVILRLLRVRRHAEMVSEIFRNLPLRIGLADHDNKVLFSLLTKDDTDSQIILHPNIKNIEEMPEPYRVEFQRMLAEVRADRQKLQKKSYTINGEHRQAFFVRLPIHRFGKDCVLWYSENIDELHRSTLDRETAADRLRLTLESISDAVVATDGTDRITICNPAAVKMMGLDGQNLIGLQLSELLNLRDTSGNRANFSPSTTAMAERRRVKIPSDTALIGHNGSRRLVEGAAGPLIDGNGQVIGSVLALHDITELVETENKYRNANTLFSSVLANLPCMVFLKDCDDNNRYILCNNAMAEKMGRSSEEIYGKTDFEIFPPQIAEKYLADDAQVLSSGSVVDIIEEVPTNNGIQIMHTLKSTLMLSGDKKMLLGISFDITKEQKLEMEARRNFQIISCLLASCPAGITAKDPADGYRHVLWNLEMTEMFGVESADAIGRFTSELGVFPDDYLAAIKEIDADVVRTGRKIEYKSKLYAKGEERIFRIIKSLAQIDDDNSLLFTMIMDVTSDERANEERTRLLSELRNYVESERIANGCLSVVAEGMDFDRTIRSLLTKVASPANADLSNVAVYDPDYSGAAIAFRWCSTDDKSETPPPIPRHLPLDNNRALDRLNDHQTIMINDLDFADAKKVLPAALVARYRSLGMKSVLLAPIFFENRLWGFFTLGFRQQREISKLDERAIQAAANAVGLALFRRSQFEKLFSSEREKTLILNNINIPIMLFDAHCRMVSRNLAAEKWRSGSVPFLAHDGKSCSPTICHFPVVPENCPVQATVKTGKPVQMEITLDGGHTYLVSTMPVFDTSGNLLNILASVADTTMENMAREHLIRAREAAEEANMAKGTFLATMSHEIRTPMNAIVGISELLEMENPPANIREHLKEMRNASDSLLNIINDVLDMSKLESERLNVTCEWVELAELLKNIKCMLQQLAAKKHLELTAVLPDKVPDIWSSAPRLRQILVNLVGNAVKFTEHGGIRIELEIDNATEKSADIVISVIDTGIGVAPELQKLVFEPFFQVEQPMRGTRSAAGTGLGLSIVKKLVERMGGEISLKSKQNVGSTFSVRFNGIQIRRHSVRRNYNAVGTDKLFHGTAWVLDDVKTNCMVLSSMLTKTGMNTEYMTNHAALLKRIAAGQRPDVLFSDMWMPDINGSELAKKLHNMPECATLPIIAVTADSEAGSNFDLGGFAGVLLKPVTMEKIRNELQKLQDDGMLK